jgi:hypothetical protein
MRFLDSIFLDMGGAPYDDDVEGRFCAWVPVLPQGTHHHSCHKGALGAHELGWP